MRPASIREIWLLLITQLEICQVGGTQQAGWSLEGQKNRVRFEITLSRIVEVCALS